VQVFLLNKNISLVNSDNDVLAIGELLIDMVGALNPYGDITYHQFFGGSPANIAVNTSWLGIKSLVCATVGKDRLGGFLKETLENAGVDTTYIRTVPDATSMVVLNQSNGTPSPIFYRAADYKIEHNQELESAVAKSKIIHFSTWPLTLSPAKESIVHVLGLARKHGVLVCFDPNFHPTLWQNPQEGKEFVKSIIGHTDIIKPSEDDAERLFGRDTHEAQIKKFLKLGAKLIIMTLGKDGLIVANANEMLKLPSLAKEVANTTGAGDAFWAGFYTATVKGHSIKEACNCGSAASAFKLKHLSSIAKLPNFEKLKEMYSL
jgi:fructokinase